MEDKSKHILKIIFGCRTGSVPSELEAMHLSDDDERKVISKSQDLFAAIVQTKWQEFNWDNTIYALSTVLKVPSKDVIDALMQVFEQCEIYFDVSKKTKEEKDWFVDDSFFAKALSDHKLFSDQIQGAKSPSATTAGATNTQTTSVQGSTATQASAGSNLGTNKDKNNHLSRAVIGQTLGQKEIMTGFVYKIDGRRADSKSYNVNVCPRMANGSSAPYKIKLTSGSGAEDCVLFFKSVGEAQAFANKIKQDDAKNKNVIGNNSMHVSRRTADPNGYLKVETVYGPAYIYASKLNEANDNEDIISLSQKHFPRQEDFNSYDDYLKSCCEQFNAMLD